MARDWLGRERQEDLASQVTRGALKWGAPVHPVPTELLTGGRGELVPVTVRKPTMPIYKGLETAYDPTKPFTGAWNESRAVWTSPTRQVAETFAGPLDLPRANDPRSLLKWIMQDRTPPPGTVIQGEIPTSEWLKGLHIEQENKAHQILLDAKNANKVFAEGSTAAKVIPTPRVNRFQLPFDPEIAKYPWFTKIAGRAARLAPGANIALGGIDMARRAREGVYVGAGLSAVSMVPGPVGWLGLGGQVLYDVGRGLIGRQGDSPVQHTPRGLLGQKG